MCVLLSFLYLFDTAGLDTWLSEQFKWVQYLIFNFRNKHKNTSTLFCILYVLECPLLFVCWYYLTSRLSSWLQTPHPPKSHCLHNTIFLLIILLKSLVSGAIICCNCVFFPCVYSKPCGHGSLLFLMQCKSLLLR